MESDSATKELFEALVNLQGEPNNEDYLSKVKERLKEATDINAVDIDEWTPLHHLATTGNTELLDMLFDRANAIWLENQKKKSLFHRIFFGSFVNKIRPLSRKGINLNAITNQRETPLHFATLELLALFVTLLGSLVASPNVLAVSSATLVDLFASLSAILPSSFDNISNILLSDSF